MSHETKIVKNTTATDIELESVGITIPALGQYVVEISEIMLWASEDLLTEIVPYLVSGDIVVNDGMADLTAAEAERALEYADRNYIEKDDVTVTKVNKILNFEGANIDVIHEGNGKTTVKISDDTSDGLYQINCPIIVCGKIIAVDIDQLVDDTLCFITDKEC